eukprot:scaffold25_cov287-Prasinococcus_capsulatus_cf.AAC.3
MHEGSCAHSNQGSNIEAITVLLSLWNPRTSGCRTACASYQRGTKRKTGIICLPYGSAGDLPVPQWFPESSPVPALPFLSLGLTEAHYYA